MNYTEVYVLRVKQAGHEWRDVSYYEDMEVAEESMDMETVGQVGSWRIDRIMTVTVATHSKARP